MTLHFDRLVKPAPKRHAHWSHTRIAGILPNQAIGLRNKHPDTRSCGKEELRVTVRQNKSQVVDHVSQHRKSRSCFLSPSSSTRADNDHHRRSPRSRAEAILFQRTPCDGPRHHRRRRQRRGTAIVVRRRRASDGFQARLPLLVHHHRARDHEPAGRAGEHGRLDGGAGDPDGPAAGRALHLDHERLLRLQRGLPAAVRADVQRLWPSMGDHGDRCDLHAGKWNLWRRDQWCHANCGTGRAGNWFRRHHHGYWFVLSKIHSLWIDP